MSVDITAVTRPRDLESLTSPTLASVYFVFDSAGWTLPKQMTADAFMTAALGANYTRVLNVASTLAALEQTVKSGSTSSALDLGTGGATVNGTFAVTDALTVTDTFYASPGSPGVVGFFGVSPVSKPTVTGSKGANAALTSLMTALANLGLVTNSTS